MYKIHKNRHISSKVKKELKKVEKIVEKVIHIKKRKKCRKMGIFTKLSTLSTPKVEKTGDYSGIEKERTFCRVVIKMKKCRKKELFILTFK